VRSQTKSPVRGLQLCFACFAAHMLTSSKSQTKSPVRGLQRPILDGADQPARNLSQTKSPVRGLQQFPTGLLRPGQRCWVANKKPRKGIATKPFLGLSRCRWASRKQKAP